MHRFCRRFAIDSLQGAKKDFRLKKPKFKDAEKAQSAIDQQFLEAMETTDNVDARNLQGTVVESKQYIAKLSGIRLAKLGDMVKFPNDHIGTVLALESKIATVGLLTSKNALPVGTTGDLSEVKIPIGKGLLNAVVDPLGHAIDAVGNRLEVVPGDEVASIHTQVKGIERGDRKVKQFTTGVHVIDGMQPLGFGDRLAIFGSKRCNKTVLAMDMLKHIGEKNKLADEKDIIHMVYVSMGKSFSQVHQIRQLLEKLDLMKYTTLVASTPDTDAVPLQFVTPYTGTEMAQYYQRNGMHAVVIYDEITAHLDVVDQLTSLMLQPTLDRRPSTVRSTTFYPSHYSVLERSGQMCEQQGGGSITSIALANVMEESAANQQSMFTDFSGALISSTDDWIMLDPNLSSQGIYPPINSISTTSSSSSWLGFSNGVCCGIKSIRGPPFQNPLLWQLMVRLQQELVDTRQVALQVEYANKFDLDPEPEVLEALLWRKIVELFWRQEPLAASPANAPTHLAMGAILLLYCKSQLINQLEPMLEFARKDEFWQILHHVSNTVQDTHPELYKKLSFHVHDANGEELSPHFLHEFSLAASRALKTFSVSDL